MSNVPNGVGARVLRAEDERLLGGGAQYLDDLEFPGSLHAAFVRSTHAHASIKSVDKSALEGLQGHVATFAGSDCSAIGIRANIAKPGAQDSFQPCLARQVVRYFGEPVAVVVADDPHRAEDLAERVRVDYEPLPSLLSIDESLSALAAPLHPGWKHNVFVSRKRGRGDLEDVRRAAARTVARTFRTNRQAPVPLETRGVVARLEPSGQLAIWSSTQVPHMVRTYVAEQLGWRESRVRVQAPDVGGGFGLKGGVFPEEILIPWLAIRLGRTVKWIESRQEQFLTSIHARDHVHDLEAYLDGNGIVLGLSARIQVDVGAYSVFPWTAGSDSGMAANVLPGPYAIAVYQAEDVAVATNKCPIGTYRGVARPSAVFSLECLMDEAASLMGLDPIEFRLRNVVREFPYQTATGLIYDSGSYAASLTKMQGVLNYSALRADHLKARSDGELIGVGIALFCEQTAHGTSELQGRGMPIMAGYESVSVQMDPHGGVLVTTGLQSHGQGLETTLAQIVVHHLTIETDAVMVVHGDTATSPYSMGTWGSRGATLGGGACSIASKRLRDKLVAIAAHHLEIESDQVELANGAARVVGTPAREISIATLANWALQETGGLPPGMEPGLHEVAFLDGMEGGVFSNACHAAVVRVNADTGRIDVLRYEVVEDCGTAINPMIVDGQIHGGVAQGIGGALIEELIYDDTGALTTTSLGDYLLPRMTDIPEIGTHHIQTPSPRSVLGIKGMGEGGAIGPLAAIANAVSDAIGVRVREVPLTPERLWRLIADRAATR